jgi:hypothetical protein
MGRHWIHAALAVPSRFLIDLRLGARTLETAIELVASVATACRQLPTPLLLIDDHLPYPAAILQVFGTVLHRRRRYGRGRFKLPRLKAPADLLAGVVQKVRNASGQLLRVRAHALFGRKREIERRIQRLDIGQQINTAHIERLNGTIRTRQARLTRRTRNGSRRADSLQWSLWLWRDLYNWTRVHGSLHGRTPAVALGLTSDVWTVERYAEAVVHVSDLQAQIWAEERKKQVTSALEAPKPRLCLPTS